MIEVKRSPCRMSWQLVVNGRVFHTEPTRTRAEEVKKQLESKGYLG